jgi:hypothetical protein
VNYYDSGSFPQFYINYRTEDSKKIMIPGFSAIFRRCAADLFLCPLSIRNKGGIKFIRAIKG